MLKIFCLFGWHTFDYNMSMTKRTCHHCGKKQVRLQVGDDVEWKDIVL